MWIFYKGTHFLLQSRLRLLWGRLEQALVTGLLEEQGKLCLRQLNTWGCYFAYNYLTFNQS